LRYRSAAPESWYAPPACSSRGQQNLEALHSGGHGDLLFFLRLGSDNITDCLGMETRWHGADEKTGTLWLIEISRSIVYYLSGIISRIPCTYRLDLEYRP
jgi:hypothetical protein